MSRNCKGYRNRRGYDSSVCAGCYRWSYQTYAECLKLTQERIDRNNKMYEDSGVSLVLFDKDNNVLKDVKLTRKQLQDIKNVIKK